MRTGLFVGLFGAVWTTLAAIARFESRLLPTRLIEMKHSYIGAQLAHESHLLRRRRGPPLRQVHHGLP